MKYSLLILLLSLMACSDQVPTTSSNEPVSIDTALDANGQLRLEIPSLLGWGEVSEVKMTKGDSIELVATLTNNNGSSIPNEPLLVTSQKGNFLTENALLTDHNGQATTLLLATILGKDQITVDHNENLSATLPITVLDPNSLGNEEDSSNFLKELPGVVSWQTLAKVTLKHDKPYFDKKIEELNGQKVKVQGFMLPLEQTETQKHFLLSVNPPTCFFCLPAGAEGLVEVYTNQAIEFSYDPVIVSGILKILTNDDMGLYYRMTNAQQVRF
jgi:hypothetical protein